MPSFPSILWILPFLTWVGLAVGQNGGPAKPPSPKEITVEALVDGPSVLHFSPTGIYWTNGGNAKPGRHEAHNYPTYVNGKAWTPKWGKDGDDRGVDQSEAYPMQIGSTEYEMEVVSISDRRGTAKKIGVPRLRPPDKTGSSSSPSPTRKLEPSGTRFA